MKTVNIPKFKHFRCACPSFLFHQLNKHGETSINLNQIILNNMNENSKSCGA